MIKKIFIAFFTLLLLAGEVNSQPPQFSIATDIGLQRSLRKGQQYWAFGHTIQAQFHVTYKDGFYFWLSYYTNGKFTNQAVATAKLALTTPYTINYINQASMGFRQFSMGYRRYLKGGYSAEEGVNIYAYGGFGILFGHVQNRLSNVIDTNVYRLPVLSGSARFKRLTVDLGLGAEFPLGGDIFLYTEGRLWIPSSDYPSKYVFIKNNQPLVAMFNGGVRILF